MISEDTGTERTWLCAKISL